VRNLSDLQRFIAKHFPQGRVDDDDGELVIRTGLCVSDGTLVSLEEDESGLGDIEPERPEFGRYRGA
jgi:hypothetical protein